MRHALLLPLLLATLTTRAQDEGFRCLANNPEELARRFAADPQLAERAAAATATLRERAALPRGGGGPYVVPVVFHIIHDNGPEDISDAQVEDAVRILNEDFNKLNPDWPTVRPEFVDLVADVGIEFRLAQRDPQGNCTNGITRTVSSLTAAGDYDMVQLIQWPRGRYLNVWVCRYASGAAGYAYYPGTVDGWPQADGIVLQYDYVGSIGTSVPYRSRVLTHETGHWLNLMHCWGDSNEPGQPENCAMDDEVEDTPLTKGWTSCLLSGASCGSALDNVQNFMEYSYCYKMFTEGQAQRMLATLTSPIAQRSSLWQPANLALTGVEGPGTVCEVRFAAGQRVVCAGGSVSFTDESYNGVEQRAWSFSGGQPATSSDAEPVVTYAAPGLYPVSLTVTDALGGTLTREEQGFIRVLHPIGQPAPWAEGFEALQTLADGEWEVRDLNGDGGFALTDAAAATGSHSVRLPNTIFDAGKRDELISTTVDLSGSASASVTFRYAFAKRNPADDDVLYVWVSPDCGSNWSLRKILKGSTTLGTAGVVAGDFVPSGPDQWGMAVITNIGASLCGAAFRVRFEFVSNGGNNLYLDDINIMRGHVGIAEQAQDEAPLRIIADAGAGTCEALLGLSQADRVRFEVLDALGRSLALTPPLALGPGTHRVPLPVLGLAGGSYLVRAMGGQLQEAVRFVMPR